MMSECQYEDKCGECIPCLKRRISELERLVEEIVQAMKKKKTTEIEPLIAGAKALANSLAPNRKKDGKCHAHCQTGCEYKVCGTCTYNGDDGCEAQYIRTIATTDKENDNANM